MKIVPAELQLNYICVRRIRSILGSHDWRWEVKFGRARIRNRANAPASDLQRQTIVSQTQCSATNQDH